MDPTTTTVLLTGGFTLGGVLLTSAVAVASNLLALRDRREEAARNASAKILETVRNERLNAYSLLLEKYSALSTHVTNVHQLVMRGEYKQTLEIRDGVPYDVTLEFVEAVQPIKNKCLLLADLDVQEAIEGYDEEMLNSFSSALEGVPITRELGEPMKKANRRLLNAMKAEIALATSLSPSL